jgi:hypothetical protein
MSDLKFQLVMAPKPSPKKSVTSGPVPADLAKQLAVIVPQVMETNDHELRLTADSARDAALLAAYARKWGTEQMPELYIRKLPNTKEMPKEVARISVQLASEVTEDQRPGRKPNAK